MIKQIKAIEENGYFVQGTDAFSIDSRDFGVIPKDSIKYKVLFKF
jgi:type IV secretory pathway protease TraF